MSTPLVPSPTPEDPWAHLRQWTGARIALGRAGGSLPTRYVMEFRLAHAAARDAVQREFDHCHLRSRIAQIPLESVLVHTKATSRAEHLRRPDHGRALDEESAHQLAALAVEEVDLSIAVSDGLSATAVEKQVIPVLEAMRPLLTGWKQAPIAVVPFGRVAVQDQIGSLLRAKLSLILIGERPGLKSPESLGAYLVHTPRVGKTDADRNCISNIHAAGVPPAQAAEKIVTLLAMARTLGYSGVQLKDPGIPTLS